MILWQELCHSKLSLVCKGKLFVQECLPAGGNLPVGGDKSSQTWGGHLFKKGCRVWGLMLHLLSPRAIVDQPLRWEIWSNVIMLTLPWSRESTGSLICNLNRNHLSMMLPPHSHGSHGLEVAFILWKSEEHRGVLFGCCQYTKGKMNSALLYISSSDSTGVNRAEGRCSVPWGAAGGCSRAAEGHWPLEPVAGMGNLLSVLL